MSGVASLGTRSPSISIFVDDDGGYEMQQFDRTLVDGGLKLDFSSAKNGQIRAKAVCVSESAIHELLNALLAGYGLRKLSSETMSASLALSSASRCRPDEINIVRDQLGSFIVVILIVVIVTLVFKPQAKFNGRIYKRLDRVIWDIERFG